MSVDPEAKTGAMVSIPRDLASFPLYAGGTYPGKINSLLSYARRNPKEFPDGATTTLVKEVGHLVGVPVHYYAAVNLDGFVTLVDLVGGVTVDNPRAIDDPRYGGWTDGRPVGFKLAKGRQKLDAQEALAFVRSRYGAGDSDFSRARRQQLLLLALQKKMTSPEMLPKLPSILAAAGDMIKTNFPAARLNEVLDLAARGGRRRHAAGRARPRVHRPLERPVHVHADPRHEEVRHDVGQAVRRGQPLLQAARVTGAVRRRRRRAARERRAGLSGPGASPGPCAP